MNERILLVGTDWNPTLVSAIFSGTEDPWEFSVSRNSLEALNCLAQEPITAIIVDQPLADANGTQLLDVIMQRHPQVLRILHTPLSNDYARLKLVGVTHQIVPKPSAPKVLRDALKRAFSFKTWLPEDSVQRLLASLGKLPSPPETYFQVTREIQSADACPQSVGELISRDPAMTAKLLQLSNSVAFGLQQQVTNAVDAVLYLGLETTKALILLAHTYSYFDHFKMGNFGLQQLWKHSVAVGEFASRIAKTEHTSFDIQSKSYTAGLLHDLGKLILAVNLPELFAQAIKSATQLRAPLWQVETELFGASHANVGAALLGIWGLPVDILEAIALHHSPSRLLNQGFCPLTAVHAANVIVHEADAPDSLQPELDANYLEALELTPHIEVWRESCKSRSE